MLFHIIIAQEVRDMYQLIRSKHGDKNSIQQRQAGELEYLVFPKLEETGVVKHLFTTRTGGVSSGIYATMNLSFSRGDDPLNVMENYRRIGEVLETDPEHMVASRQTHTTNIHAVTDKDCGNGIGRASSYEDIDGLVTDVPGIALVTYYADCVPLYFVDPVHRAIGLAHSGWRGTVAGMAACMVLYMQEHFHSRPEELVTAIGPSICADCYEIGEDVAEQFRGHFPEKVLQKGKTPGKYQLDLWQANRSILLNAGVLPEHIAVTDVCTCHNPEYLFSHRASHGQRGNLAAFLMLKNNSQ